MHFINVMLNFLRGLLGDKTPDATRYIVNWATSIDCTYEVETANGTMICGQVMITPHSQVYEATSIEQAKAMHYSDNPGTKITSIFYLSK